MRPWLGWFWGKRQLLLPFDSSSGAMDNYGHMFWVVLWQIQHRLFANPIWQGYCLGEIGYLCPNLSHSSRIRGSPASIAGLCSKSRCTGESWAYIVRTVTAQLPTPFREQHSLHDYWVGLSEYETSAHLCVAKLQCVQEYHSLLGTPQIGIPEHRKLRHGSGIHGKAAPFAAGYVLAYHLAYDWSSGTTEICKPVQNDVLGFPWGQLWQAATHYECVIPGQAHLNSNNMPPKCMFPTS